MQKLSATWNKICLGPWTTPHNSSYPCCSKLSLSLVKMLSFPGECFLWFSVQISMYDTCLWCMENQISQACATELCQAWQVENPGILINTVAFFHFQKWVLWNCVFFFSEGWWRRKFSCNFPHFSDIVHSEISRTGFQKKLRHSGYRLKYWNFFWV